MTDSEIKTTAKEERKRIKALLKDAGISERRMQMLEPVIENTAWMKAKLDDAREQIKNSNVAIKYDNGGGQKGIRQNPAFKGYESLWRSYMQGMNRILDTLPAEKLEAETYEPKPKTVLDAIREKHEGVTGTKNKNRAYTN